MRALPEGVTAYGETREFDQDTVPAGLLRAHTTRAGTWGRIVVRAGALTYRIFAPDAEPEEIVLTPGGYGVIEPEVPHEVEPLGNVRFVVEFWK